MLPSFASKAVRNRSIAAIGSPPSRHELPTVAFYHAAVSLVTIKPRSILFA